MAFPVTLNGRTYTLTDFEGTNYVDGLPDAFEDFVTHAGDIYNSTSTTSNSIGTGSKTFTVEANKPYQAGTPLRIADAAAPSTNFLDTVVTSYSGTTLVVNSIGFGGSGTKTSWTVNIGGAKTVDGTLGLSQGGTGATDAAGARTNIDVYSKADADSRFLNVSGEASDVVINGDLTVDGTATIRDDAATTSYYSTDVASNVVTHTLNGTGAFAQEVWKLNDGGTPSERMRLTTTGLGIGTSPSYTLDVSAANAVGMIRTPDTTPPTLGLFVNSGSNGVGAISVDNGGHMTFDTGSSGAGQAERMRLDSSGRLLHGKTTSGDYVTGTEIQPSGAILSYRTGGVAAIHGRTDDGEIIRLTSNSSIAGSIGTFGGQAYFINSSNKGIRMYTNGIAAAGSSGAFEDASQDLGASSVRWRDLYLSGGVYLGGTGSANKLDDYEEGTWTPNVYNSGYTSSWGFKSGRYTKIGNTVHCWARFDGGSTGAGTGNLVLTGLPFASKGSTATWNHCGIVGLSGGVIGVVGVGTASSGGSSGYIWNGSGYINFVATFISMQFSYETDS